MGSELIQNPFDQPGVVEVDEIMTNFSKIENELNKHGTVIVSAQGTWKCALITMSEYEHYLQMKEGEEDLSVQKQLQRLLNSVGKKFFVDYYYDLKAGVQASSLQHISEMNHWPMASVRSRISRSRTVFFKGWEIDALRQIIDSRNTDDLTRERAQQVLAKELDTPEGIIVNTSFQRANRVNETFDRVEQSIEKQGNKNFAFKCMELLSKNNKLTDDLITLLTDKDTCKALFNCRNFPVLSEVSLSREPSEEDYCVNGKQRFYKSKIVVGDRAFILTNHWYGPNKSLPDNRTPFQLWVQDIVRARD